MKIEDITIDNIEELFNENLPTFANDLKRAKESKRGRNICKIGIVYQLINSANRKYIGSTYSLIHDDVNAILASRKGRGYDFDYDRVEVIFIFENIPVWKLRSAEGLVQRSVYNIDDLLNKNHDFMFRSELFTASGDNSFQKTIGSGAFPGQTNPMWKNYKKKNWTHPKAKKITTNIKLSNGICLEFTNRYTASAFFAHYRFQSIYLHIDCYSYAHMKPFEEKYFTTIDNEKVQFTSTRNSCIFTDINNKCIWRGIKTKAYAKFLELTGIEEGAYIGEFFGESVDDILHKIDHITNNLHFANRYAPSRQ